MRVLALAFTLQCACAVATVTANAARMKWLQGAPPLVNATDCLMRSYMIERALEVNGALSNTQVAAMIDALSGDPTMGAGCIVNSPRVSLSTLVKHETTSLTAATPTFFCDAVNGNDANDGTLVSPFLTVGRGIAAVRAAGQGGGTVNLRGGGTFYVNATLTLSSVDSGLTIQTYPLDAEIAWLSGSVPLTDVVWSPVNTSGANIWRATLAGVPGLASVEALRDDGSRLIRARYPNADPETGLPFLHTHVQADSWIPTPNATHWSSWTPNASYNRNDSTCSR